MSTLKIKLIDFPNEVKEQYVELNASEYFLLVKENAIKINNKSYKIKHKRINHETKEFEIVFDNLSAIKTKKDMIE